jgi:hypothetical protein
MLAITHGCTQLDRQATVRQPGTQAGGQVCRYEIRQVRKMEDRNKENLSLYGRIDDIKLSMHKEGIGAGKQGVNGVGRRRSKQQGKQEMAGRGVEVRRQTGW